MKMGNFPIERTLEFRAEHTPNLAAAIDMSCPGDRLFSDITNMEPLLRGEVDAFSKGFYAVHTDIVVPRSEYIAQPMHFGALVASLLIDDDNAAQLEIPGSPDWGVPTKDGDKIDARTMVDYFLSISPNLDELIRANMQRISGRQFNENLIVEPDEVKHARLLSGLTFLLIDIVSAREYEKQRLADIKVTDELEKLFVL